MNRKCVAVVLAALILTAAAYAQTEADFNVTLTKESDGVVITKYTGKATAVRIPATIQGMPVREIGERAFQSNYDITSVIIPAGVIKIGDYAFLRDYKLTSVTIPEGVLEIGEGSFYQCSALITVTLPKSLISLGAGAFVEVGISAITLPAALINFPKNDAGQYGAFDSCRKLKTVNLPAGMTLIPSGMFSGCTALTTIALPDSIEGIDNDAFSDCTALTSINLPNSFEGIGFKAFNNCKALTSITLPPSIKILGTESFSNCKALTTITINSNLQIYPNAFAGCSALTTVTISDSVEKIEFLPPIWGDNDAFVGCGKLTLASQAALKKRGYTGKF